MNAEPRLRWGLPRAAWIAFGLMLLGFLVAVLIARRYPLVGGLFLLLLAALTLAALRSGPEETRLSFGALLVTPPLIAGAALIREGEH